MRSSTLGMIDNVSAACGILQTITMFEKLCLSREFEKNVARAYNLKKIQKIPIYLSLGQESITAALSTVLPNIKQFGQHRCHDIYICWGGNLIALKDELLGLASGCASGMGGSASIHSPANGMFGHDGLMGTQVPIAVGYALGSGGPTLAIMGDASAEEGYVLGALGEAASKKAPVLFVCYDNNLSILTEVSVRRSWTIADEARAKGIPAIDITDDPWLVMYYAEKLRHNLPAFMNIRTCRELWHAGTGCDGPPEWNRFELTRKEMHRLGLSKEASTIEKNKKSLADEIWNNTEETK
jgi:TPP-dependent pyruvate/acetoin dehydrogenase alpha subunit